MLILPLLQEQQGERVIGDRGYDCNELIDKIARYGSDRLPLAVAAQELSAVTSCLLLLSARSLVGWNVERYPRSGMCNGYL